LRLDGDALGVACVVGGDAIEGTDESIVARFEPPALGAEGPGVGLGALGLGGVARVTAELDDDEQVDDPVAVILGDGLGESGRVERVERYTEAIRALADEGGDATLIAEMLGEADADAKAAAEAALEVLRERQKALAFAETRVALAREELERSRQEVQEIEASIERIKEQAIRPLCEAAGQGDTRAIKTETGRVSLRRTPGRVELDDDPDLLDYIAAADPGLVRIKREPDRAAISAALKLGREVPGARLVVETKVEVRG